jgi:2-keto-3-deoxy-L-rhamnonate aldolase RhmA
MKTRDKVRTKVADGAVSFGLLQTVPDTHISYIAAMSGFDFIVLDSEHGTFCEPDYLPAMLATGTFGVTTIVRLRDQDPTSLGRCLDMGIDGIMVPNVRTAHQATELVRAMHFPPKGSRGYAGSIARSSGYGLELENYRSVTMPEPFLCVMIESEEGVDNVEEIVRVEGISAVVVGHYDLSASLGIPGDFAQPGYERALRRIEEAAATEGKTLGSAPHPDYPVEKLITRGHRLVTLGVDARLIREAMTAQVKAGNQAIAASGVRF